MGPSTSRDPSIRFDREESVGRRCSIGWHCDAVYARTGGYHDLDRDHVNRFSGQARFGTQDGQAAGGIALHKLVEGEGRSTTFADIGITEATWRRVGHPIKLSSRLSYSGCDRSAQLGEDLALRSD